MVNAQELIQKTIDRSGKNIPEEAKEGLKDVFTKMYEQGMSPREAMGFGKDMIDFAYQYAYSSFQTGKYKDALNVFIWLRTLEPLTYNYVFGVATCYHRLEMYGKAIGQYALCAGIETDNPEPCLYMAQCFFALNTPEGAVPFLKEAIARAEGKSQYARTDEIAHMLLRKIEGAPIKK